MIQLLLLGTWIAGCAPLCKDGQPGARVADFEPGEYDVTFVAEQGSKAGQEIQARLSLARDEDHWAESRIFGSLVGDLAAVGAPIDWDFEPVPDSSDPEAPGVVLHSVSWDEEYPDNTPVLTVGAASNRNPVVGTRTDGTTTEQFTLDGPGIGLWVHRIHRGGFAGRWSEWGLLVDGRGTFCAEKISE